VQVVALLGIWGGGDCPWKFRHVRLAQFTKCWTPVTGQRTAPTFCLVYNKLPKILFKEANRLKYYKMDWLKGALADRCLSSQQASRRDETVTRYLAPDRSEALRDAYTHIAVKCFVRPPPMPDLMCSNLGSKPGYIYWGTQLHSLLPHISGNVN
jgi:hypothetical protein